MGILSRLLGHASEADVADVEETLKHALADDEDVENEFSEDGGSYVATGLTFPKLDRIKEEKAARAGTLGAAVREGRVVVTPAATPHTGPWHTSRPWGSH